ncbi:Panacea domain-containing protein [Nocardia jiangsuensis]|uniref:Panacea domain-containing protein n=1 Tax=Nocardia jiangsuensis TaxID=1691563 RepID=A0ABV8DQB7_9NOCA
MGTPVPVHCYPAPTIARWFVDWATTEDAGVSNLKLQKLLYYAQGHHLAEYEAPLFEDPVQAWRSGPVVPAVFREFEGFGAAWVVLAEDDPFHWDAVDADTTRFLTKVWNTYGGIAGWKLRNMTQAEPAWQEYVEQDEGNVEIPVDVIAKYFHARRG